MHVLIVEDNRHSLQLLDSIISDEGHTTALADNGVKALQLLSAENFDLMVSDVQMPLMDGFDLGIEARKQGFTSKIILMSAGIYDAEELDSHLGKIGNVEFIHDKNINVLMDKLKVI